MQIKNQDGGIVSLEHFNAAYLGHVYTAADVEQKYLWDGFMRVPLMLGNKQKFDAITIRMLFDGAEQQEINAFAENVKTCEISEIETLEGLCFQCYLTGTADIKNHPDFTEKEFKYLCLAFGYLKTIEVTTQSSIFVEGIKTAEAVIEFANTTELEITSPVGLNEYVVDGMEVGEIITIDGVKKMVGSNKRADIFKTMNFARFPALTSGSNSIVTSLPEGAQIKIRYRPRY